MTLKLAINGFGRIGRGVLRAVMESGRTDVEIVAINDLGKPEMNAHLFEFDSVHGRYPNPVTLSDAGLDVGRGPIRLSSERNPEDLPGRTLTSFWNVRVCFVRARRRNVTSRTDPGKF